MANVFDLKEQSTPETPLLLVDCEFSDGSVEHWSTHEVERGGLVYNARVVRHNLFEMETSSEQGVDGIPRLSVTLANADSRCSELDRLLGFKGAKVMARLVFFDLKSGEPFAESGVLFRGIANPPEEITESVLRVMAVNRMGMQRALLPSVRIQRRCPWEFPRTPEQRQEAITGGDRGRYSRFFRCGYSAGVEGGAGNLNDGAPFTSCAYTRADCTARGLFSTDVSGGPTRRFGGFEFVPPSIEVRSYGEKGWHLSGGSGSEARYNDFVPLVYGTAWYEPPITCARNDGNLTHMEVLVGMGEMQGVMKVLVNDIEIPQGQSGANMTATGWYNVVSLGNRTGAFNLDLPSGDPHGSMAYISVVVPNRINDGRALPRVKVLAQGLRLPVFGSDGGYVEDRFTANPAWVLLDILQRSGWTPDEIDLGSFARAASYCGEEIQVVDAYGNPRAIPRFECNLVAQKRRSVADLIRGARNAARLFLTYGGSGQLEVQVENTLALQQPVKPAWSNAAEELNGGWPSYEFGDGTNGTSGIIRRANGEASVRVWSRSIADTPNRFTVEFQDAFNEYQQDSFSLVDVDDTALTGQEVHATLAALGIPNYDQAARILKCRLDKSVHGNTYIEFESSVKALGLRPGDLICLTYLKEGFERQPFRVVRVAPGMNYRTVRITAQIHKDEWYDDTNGAGEAGGRREAGAGLGIPRPLSGSIVDEQGNVQFGIVESAAETADGGTAIELAVAFAKPAMPGAASAKIPLVSLAAVIGENGTLAGAQSLYYAVSAVDGAGDESALSFTVHAALPGEASGYSVMLQKMSFAPGTAGFHVYRGLNPAQMCRIAENQPVAEEFNDNGLSNGTQVPPDANYDHANFYWRPELVPEYGATIHSAASIGNDALEMPEDEYAGMIVRVISGKGAGQEGTVAGNTASTLTLSSAWTIEPDATSRFTVAEPGWRFGATAKSGPVRFEVPNRTGAVVQISGRAANAIDQESPAELCTLTRWQIGGAGGGDAEVPPAPMFAVGAARSHGGYVELSSVGFPDLTNTRTITAGTLALYYWDELSGLSQHASVGEASAEDESIDLNVTGMAEPGTYVQIGKEILRVEEVLNEGMGYRVQRGAHGSIPAAHAAQTTVYHLSKKVAVVPFVPGFFGSPLSGHWSYAIPLANARVASAEFSVTNGKGTSEISEGCLTQNPDCGLRTLAGGQFSFQVEGFLAVDSAPAPDLIVESPRSVRDIFAVVREAPDSNVALSIKQNDVEYCSLTIAAGATMSDVVDGFALGPLEAGAHIRLEVLSVGTNDPGADLTVVIRL